MAGKHGIDVRAQRQDLAVLGAGVGHEAFDESLRSRNPEWGLRELESVSALADAAGFGAPAITEMPANNLSLVFRRL